MQNIAAIDIGSNAMRMVVGRVDYEGRLDTIDNVRLPVRLGQDVFSEGQIGEETAQLAVDAFLRFRKVADNHKVEKIRAVATSAMREASNRDLLCDRISHAAGIQVEIVAGDEEARLIHLAVEQAINLKSRRTMLVDIGGGSVEVTLSQNGTILSTESYNMGTVRLLQKLSNKPARLSFDQLVREYAEAARRRIDREIGQKKIDLCVGTGGNIEEMGVLRKRIFNRDSSQAITLTELEKLIETLGKLGVEQRMRRFKLRSDRADVILPAAIVLHMIIQAARISEVKIPNVGLKDGLLLDMARNLGQETRPSQQDQIWTSAVQLGEKYQYDSEHARLVSYLAGSLFRQTASLHNLDQENKLLLEVAAWLHDIGHFISTVDHDQHAFYILQASPLIGLTDTQNRIVANVMRYHRKAMPSVQDENFRMLAPRDRLIVTKLSALLRLADAMDVSHTRRVSEVQISPAKNKWKIKINGQGGLSLELWALEKRRSLFQEVFGIKLEVEA